jgi:hypothetical protein
MSNISRKIERNKIKKELGNNNIKDYFHTQHDTLEQRMKKAKVGGALYAIDRGKLF